MDKNKIICDLLNIKNDININKVSMNSKELENGDLFIAIRGGNNFIDEALKQGAYVIYDNKDVNINKENENRVFFVEDSIEFLQKFAKKWRENLNVKIIGITGSNGKTTVKDMIYHILSAKFKGKKTEGNYNNHIGLPFTLMRMEQDDEFMILEMGMSDFGEIDLLGQISEPNIAVITNIGESHLEFLKTKENVFKAKTEILPYVKETVVINGDDFYLKNINENNFENGKELVKVLNLVENEFNANKNFYYGDIKFDENNTNFELKYFGRKCQSIVERNYNTNVLGEHNILNLTLAIAVAKQFGMEDKIICEAIKNIELTDMRFQKIEKDGIIYINDAYNASPMSMQKSIETFSEIYNDKEKIAVLGDMLELGENELQLHEDLAQFIENAKVHRLYLYGPRIKSLYEKMVKKDISKYENLKEIEYFEKKDDIKNKIKRLDSEKVVLIKGSRGMKLEEII